MAGHIKLNNSIFMLCWKFMLRGRSEKQSFKNVEVTFPVEFFSFSWISTIIFYSRSPHRCPRSSFHCTKVV